MSAEPALHDGRALVFLASAPGDAESFLLAQGIARQLAEDLEVDCRADAPVVTRESDDGTPRLDARRTRWRPAELARFAVGNDALVIDVHVEDDMVRVIAWDPGRDGERPCGAWSRAADGVALADLLCDVGGRLSSLSLGKSIEGLADKSPVVQELMQKYLGVGLDRGLPKPAVSANGD